MFDDLESAENKTEEAKNSSGDKEITSWWIGRWAHVIALLTFCLIYYSFDDRFWSWQVAVTLAYAAFVLCCTCGLSFQDSDDFIGSPEVVRYMAFLLLRQILIIALMSLAAYMWRRLIPVLPGWANTKAYRNLSLWQVGGALVAYYIAIKEATWMAKRIKQKFPDLKEPLDFIESTSSSS